MRLRVVFLGFSSAAARPRRAPPRPERPSWWSCACAWSSWASPRRPRPRPLGRRCRLGRSGLLGGRALARGLLGLLLGGSLGLGDCGLAPGHLSPSAAPGPPAGPRSRDRHRASARWAPSTGPRRVACWPSGSCRGRSHERSWSRRCRSAHGRSPTGTHRCGRCGRYGHHDLHDRGPASSRRGGTQAPPARPRTPRPPGADPAEADGGRVSGDTDLAVPDGAEAGMLRQGRDLIRLRRCGEGVVARAGPRWSARLPTPRHGHHGLDHDHHGGGGGGGPCLPRRRLHRWTRRRRPPPARRGPRRSSAPRESFSPGRATSAAAAAASVTAAGRLHVLRLLGLRLAAGTTTRGARRTRASARSCRPHRCDGGGGA